MSCPTTCFHPGSCERCLPWLSFVPQPHNTVKSQRIPRIILAHRLLARSPPAPPTRPGSSAPLPAPCPTPTHSNPSLLTWRAQCPNLEVVASLGAGVDHILNTGGLAESVAITRIVSGNCVTQSGSHRNRPRTMTQGPWVVHPQQHRHAHTAAGRERVWPMSRPVPGPCANPGSWAQLHATNFLQPVMTRRTTTRPKCFPSPKCRLPPRVVSELLSLAMSSSCHVSRPHWGARFITFPAWERTKRNAARSTLHTTQPQGECRQKGTTGDGDHARVPQVDPLMAQRMSTFVTWAVINGHRGMDGHAEAQRSSM